MQIEFVVTDSPVLPTQTQQKYRNLVVKDHLRKYIFSAKSLDANTPSYYRILPALKGSRSWVNAIEVIDTGVEMFRPNPDGPFARAHAILKKDHPQLIYSRTNPHGIRLRPKLMGLIWLIKDKPTPPKLTLLLKSLYDGNYGGSLGLARKITEIYKEKMEEGVDIIHPDKGRMIALSKINASILSDYKISVGKKEAPINLFTSELSETEKEDLCPLEEVSEIISVREEAEILRRYLTGVVPDAESFLEQILQDTPFAIKPVSPALPAAPDQGGNQEFERFPDSDFKPKKEPEPAAEKENNDPPYTTREIASIISKGGKAGIELLLKNWHRLDAEHREIVREYAEEYGIKVKPDLR